MVVPANRGADCGCPCREGHSAANHRDLSCADRGGVEAGPTHHFDVLVPPSGDETVEEVKWAPQDQVDERLVGVPVPLFSEETEQVAERSVDVPGSALDGAVGGIAEDGVSKRNAATY